MELELVSVRGADGRREKILRDREDVRVVEPKYHTFKSAEDALIAWAETFMESITKRYPKFLSDAWTEKRERAEKYLAGTATADDIGRIETEATLRNKTKAELAARILVKGKSFLDLEPVIAPMFDMTRDALEAVTDEALAADPFAYDKVLSAALSQAEALAVSEGV